MRHGPVYTRERRLVLTACAPDVSPSDVSPCGGPVSPERAEALKASWREAKRRWEEKRDAAYAEAARDPEFCREMESLSWA